MDGNFIYKFIAFTEDHDYAGIKLVDIIIGKQCPVDIQGKINEIKLYLQLK